MIPVLFKVKKILSDLKKNDENFVYFIAFLYSISTGQIGAVELIKTTKGSSYGKYSKSFSDIFKLGVGWSFGLARSCEMIAIKVSDKNDDYMKQLLVKLAQVVKLGDDLEKFLRDDLKNTLSNYSIVYERNLESQKLFLEIFYTMMSTAAFMTAANSIMAMLMGSNSEQIVVMSFVGVGVGMSSFVFLMYLLFPRDKLAYGQIFDKTFRMRMFAAIGVGFGIGVILLATGLVPSTLVVAIAAAPLLFPGMTARKVESRIKERDKWYPGFISHFGQIYSTVGSVGLALNAVLKSNFGPLQEFIVAFKNRTRNRIHQTIAFDLISRETESQIIRNGNSIVSATLEKGGDLNEVGNVVSDVTKKINEVREKRAQTAKTFETVVIVLHVLSLAVFGLMNKLTEIFGMMSTVDVSNSAVQLSAIDPEFFVIATPILIIMTSIISGFAIKVAQGGLYKTVVYNIALLAVLGSVVMFVITHLLSGFLENSILELDYLDV